MGRTIVFVLVSYFVCHQLFITIDAQMNFTFGQINCLGEDFNYTRGSAYETNLGILMATFVSRSPYQIFRYGYEGDVLTESVYGFFQCRYDITLDDCGRCVKQLASEIVTKCPLYGEAILWYEECLVRYANRENYFYADMSPVFRRSFGDDFLNPDVLRPILEDTFTELNAKASVVVPRFATNNKTTSRDVVEELYTYVHCIQGLIRVECRKCLKAALSELMECCSDSQGAMVSLPSCELRYDTIKPFLINDLPPQEPDTSTGAGWPPAPIRPVRSPPPINDQPSQKSPNSTKQGPKTVIIAAIAAGIGGAVLVIIVGYFICLRRYKPKETSQITSSSIPQYLPRVLQDGTENADEENIGEINFVEYDFATLKTATRDFSDGNRLGQGGFGTVYKGTLENGEHWAIKRLSGTSGQGTREFTTESLLLAKLQHKHLVKLMGFCSEGDEKLLVYEFMPNGSLDGFLFDPRKLVLLDWAIRCKIILGIARGLQYLHEDSRLTIIHRDLKPGNILLDNDMNPKVADFGLAKLVEIAQRFGSTSRIAGTLGYMAPEYMMSGEYSEKSDVYSYGIMLLEILSGKNNLKFFQTQKEDLPVHAWRLWNEDRSLELIDAVLMNNFPSNDVMRWIQIGLLCLQADPIERPTMTFVVIMLTCDVDLPLPSAPAMSIPQFNMPMTYSGTQQGDQNSTKSDTMQSVSDQDEDLYPQPR